MGWIMAGMAVWHSALKNHLPGLCVVSFNHTGVLSQLTQVTAEHAQAAYDESFDSVHMFMLLNAPPLAKVLLAAILQERRATGAPLQGGPSCRLAAVSGLVPTISVVHVGASRPSSSGRCHCLESECATLCLSWSNVMCG
jgi:hypothetical protein